MDNTFTKIEEQIPEFAREQFPRFVEFLEEYYRFLSQYNTSIEHSRNADLSSQELYSFIRREVADKFPAAMINDVKLAGTIRKLYQSKGTLNAIELLFRIFFNESVIIKQPGKNVLRASDGRWQIEKSILVDSLYGEIDFTRQIILSIDNDRGRYYVEVIKYEEPEYGQYNFYFRANNLLEVVDNQLVDIYTDGELTYQGILVKSPSHLRIINPGKFWRVGQVFRIPGSLKDTIARVSSIDINSGVGSTEIFEYGGEHSENQISFISPFPNKPAEDDYSIVPVITGYNISEDRYIFDYTLTINDSTQMTTDSTVGVSDTQTALSYYLDDYNELSVDPRYNGTQVLTQSTTLVEVPDIFVESNVTLSDYNLSVALFELRYEYIINHRGEFGTDDGMLSNDNIRMQDNFFYQAFSYVIETQRNVHEYSNILNMVHPAGLKFFGELAKISFINLDASVVSYVSINIRYATDDVDVAEMLHWYLTKPEEDEVIVVDHMVYEMIKPLSHDVTVDDSWHKEVDLNKFNSITTADGITTKEFGKNLTHSIATTDAKFLEILKEISHSVTTNDDTYYINTEKWFEHTVSIDGGNFDTAQDLIIIQYNAEDYFDPSYVITEKTITIS